MKNISFSLFFIVLLNFVVSPLYASDYTYSDQELLDRLENHNIYEARHLINQGAKINKNTPLPNKIYTNFDYELLQVYLDAGLDPSKHLSQFMTGLALNIRLSGMSSFIGDGRQKSPKYEQFIKCYKKLLDAGANPNAKGRDNCPLIIQAFKVAATDISNVDDYRDIVKLLLDAGADVNVSYPTEEAIDGEGAIAICKKYCPNQINVLCMAAFYMDEDIVAHIIETDNSDLDDIEAAINIAKNRILTQHQDEVIAVLKQYRDDVKSGEKDETEVAEETEDDELSQQMQVNSLNAIRREEYMMSRYIFIGSICAGIFLIVIIVIIVNSGNKHTIVLTSSLTAKKRISAATSANVPIVTPRSKRAKGHRPLVNCAHLSRSKSYIAPSQQAHVSSDKVYMILMADGSQNGPFSLADLRAHLQAGYITPDTFVWCQGMPDWQPAHSVMGR